MMLLIWAPDLRLALSLCTKVSAAAAAHHVRRILPSYSLQTDILTACLCSCCAVPLSKMP